MSEVWSRMTTAMNANPEPIRNENVRYEFQLKEGEAKQLVLQNGEASIEEAGTAEPNCTLKLSEKDLVKMIEGDLSASGAFMFGKLKVEGKMGYALKLESLLSEYTF
ncbi:SCP2 sterol-binding domain-containing protein [Jeotgalibacillus haloalkalitolerans]|uniref:SCP2 sterol-binding domain-containing protein n=1 Tax=Jeotgalibacillus haloalkalitolerans TaxID=3104292 RepID=A0ABU5KNL0_9BACL|nr:SCP2 sterol-binding domain-containing protein [Jeotgalibacillus sp. HH7-29]MDZ5712849.1 SCP2 sterol-binding domain-containing protein [Jeotgalibacillus sp. HH7-29]